MDEAFDRLLTPRLVIRRFQPADAPALARYRSIPAVARFQSWDAPFPQDRAAAFVDWLRERHPDVPGEWFQFAIAERDAPDVLVGDCAFHSHADEARIADVGFTLDPAMQGRGYAREAVGALLAYLFDTRGKHKAVADCDTRNGASWRLLEHLGFVREGELRDSYHDGDGWASEYLYGLLAAEWRAQ